MRFQTLILASCICLEARLAAASAWTIPGIVNAPGLNGTKFVSDLTVTNPGTAPAQAVVSFLPASGAEPMTLSLAPGQTLISSNVLSSLFGLSGVAGALSISSDQALLVRARTYNASQTGTYGVALPVFAHERLLTPGETGESLWISQDSSGTSGYRTNLAVVFPDEGGGEATVTVYDAEGNERGSKTFSLDAAGFLQASVASFAGAVPVGRAQIHVTDGRAAGYAVVNDNVTGDSSLFTFEDPPAGVQDVLINGVARANGRNNSFFRTDGRFYNPSDTAATVQVSFLASGGSNTAPATASFVLPAGKIRDVVDVLSSLLGLPVGSSGALRFRSDWPVGILCRTSNVDPTGQNPGTFGSQQKPVPLLSFLSSADAGAIVAGIRQNAAFRTNVGFAAGADGANYSLTLKSANGNTAATTSGSLGSFGWTQPNVADLFPGAAIPDDATLLVKVTSGSVDVYDSSIDNTSGDSVLTPIAPIPAAIPSSATIGPAGGSIRSDDGRLTLRVPAGALSSTVAISIQTQTFNDAPQGSGASYAISPGALGFSGPATLTLRYDSTDVDGSSSGALGLALKNASLWYVVSGGSVDAAARSLTVPIASTAPSTSNVPTDRRELADASKTDVALFRSFKISPARKALSPGSVTNFSVLTVGPSSSQIYRGILPPPLVAPASTGDGTYHWDANGDVSNSGTQGAIFDHGPFAQYKAPSCAPQMNPVVITVRISSTKVDGDHNATATAKVRILPKDWFLSAVLSVGFKCPSDLLFKVQNNYGAGRWALLQGLTLSENTKRSNPDPKTALGAPAACNPQQIGVKLVGSPEDSLEVTLYDSSYDEDADLFDLSLTLRTKQTITYEVLQKSVGKTSSQLLQPLELTGHFDFKAGEGSDFSSEPYGYSYFTLWLKLKPSKDCP